MQVFVETLDRCFENVCELDLIFHVDKVHNILQEVCMGGMVLETNMTEILTHVEAQNKLEKSESSPTSAIRVRQCITDCLALDCLVLILQNNTVSVVVYIACLYLLAPQKKVSK